MGVTNIEFVVSSNRKVPIIQILRVKNVPKENDD